MIMVLTNHGELREQLNEALRESGHRVAMPPHRKDMVSTLEDSHPDLIILDMYLDNPSGAEDLKRLREHGYQGSIVVLSGPSMRPVVKEAYARGVETIVQFPAKINGRFDLGELQATIKSCMSGSLQKRK